MDNVDNLYYFLQGKMIILDLYSELRPQYTRLQSYFGQPFIWCMLHDFGGTVQMYGALENINKVSFKVDYIVYVVHFMISFVITYDVLS